MTPEEKSRQDIDRLLAAGWDVQNYKQLNLDATLGVAVRESPTGIGDDCGIIKELKSQLLAA